MSLWLKEAVAVGSGVPDPVAQSNISAPVPQIGIENKPAPGQIGPRGMHGRTTYSRVNTGTPPTPDAGAASQKSQPPRGMESLKMAQAEIPMTSSTYMRQPSLQDLIKVAMEGSAAKIDLSLEAALQMASDGHTPPAVVKTAAAAETIDSIPTELTSKLASAMYFMAKELNPKLANIDLAAGSSNGVGPGSGPGALPVTPAKADGDGSLEAGQSGKATPANQPPLNPPMQSDPTRPGPSNQLQTNDKMQHPSQPVEPIANEKTTLTNENVKASSAYLTNLVACGLAKVAMAEDGSVVVVPADGVEKIALIGGAMGAAESPAGYRMRGAGAGEAGTQLGGLAGGIGGGAMGAGLGGLAGGAIGTLAGGFAGAPLIGGGLGALTGASLGATGGAIGGGLYGRQKGYEAAMRPYREIKDLRQQAAAQQAPQEEMQVTAAAALPSPGAPTPAVAPPGRNAGRIAGAVAGIPAGPVGILAGRSIGGAIGQRMGGGVKQASAEDLYEKNRTTVGLLKAAEDAINPAQVSAGRTQFGATPPQGAAPSEEGVPSEPSDVQAQKRKMLASNEAAINFTRRDAKGDPKSDLKDILHEPALNAGTDTVLQQTLSHNNEAGSKISSVLKALKAPAANEEPSNSVKLASARAIISKMAAADCASDKKTKKAQMGVTPPAPTAAMNGQQAAKTNV